MDSEEYIEVVKCPKKRLFSHRNFGGGKPIVECFHMVLKIDGVKYDKHYVYVRGYDSATINGLHYGEYFKYERNYRTENPGPLCQKDLEILKNMQNKLKNCRDQPLVDGEYYYRKWFRLSYKNFGIPSNSERFKLKALREQLLDSYKCSWSVLCLIYLKQFIPNDPLRIIIKNLGVIMKAFDHVQIGWKKIIAP
jgi:hypothetical protein